MMTRTAPTGFTLIEMMISIAIVIILIQLATPSFMGAIKRYQAAAIKDELEATIHLARAEAVRRGTPIQILRTTTCGKVIVSRDDWSCGWEMFADVNANGVKNIGEQVLQTYAAPNSYQLTHPSKGENLGFNIWGGVSGLAHRFVIKPNNESDDRYSIALCISSGTRLRTIMGRSTCS